ncbi:MAG: hypothetical protein ABIF19_01855 [Planctomycetota bacterium]
MLPIRTQHIGQNLRSGFEVELDGLFCNLLARGLCFSNRWLRCRSASFEELCILLLAGLWEPVDVKELRQGAFDGGVVKSHRDKAAALIQRIAKPERTGLQLRPV